jgi:hypothetical protein
MKVRDKTLKAHGVGIWQAQFHLRALRDRTTILPLRLISIYLIVRMKAGSKVTKIGEKCGAPDSRSLRGPEFTS